MAGRIDAFRVATDPAYAAKLSSADWAALRGDPDMQVMIVADRGSRAHSQ